MVEFSSFTKDARFQDLIESVQHCNLCPRLAQSRRVLSTDNGSLKSSVLFIAEAPGRLGADKTGIPLSGDQTGHNFNNLLKNIGWERDKLFITNAILCNPRDSKGNNGSPTQIEIANCAAYLKMIIDLVDPEVIVALGAVALSALKVINPHRMTLSTHLGKPSSWAGRIVYPLYHPGPRAAIHRSLANQRADFMRLAKFVDPISGLKRQPKKTESRKQALMEAPSAFQQAAVVITNTLKQLPYFKLTKLLFLSDLRALEEHGETITGQIYLRQPEGPWPPKMLDELKALDGFEIQMTRRGRTSVVEIGPAPRFDVDLDSVELETIFDIVERYGQLSNSRIKTSTYSTSPMRYILREERRGRDLRRLPVIYKNSTAEELDSLESP